MSEATLVALIVAALGSGGVTAVVTSIIGSVRAARRGVAIREDQRKDDLVRARDEALAIAARARVDADASDARADRERAFRIRLQEHASRLRRQLIAAGIEPVEPAPKE
ncbi:membrane protein [Microbacterium phage Katzastrophic]|uniref:membrane protein n=1 Tax=Microbacterium phage Katzastrophic TaxID=2912654 RepID=UPI00242B6AC4|nr:membrane protein [Microbacterium phage Katzastrophic]UKH48459.1 membrane protein [Microbacterium phage Katzastrophic]